MDYERINRVLAMLYGPLRMDEKAQLPFYYIGRQALEETVNAIVDLRSWLDNIERIARDAFSDPETQDINLYRAQALAKIFQIFEYDGATLKKDEEV